MGRPKAGTHAVPTVDRILEAAEQAFGAQGFTLARLEDIADEASIRRPSLLYHFSTKHKLYEAVVHRLFAVLMQTLAEAVAETESYEERVLGLMQAFVDHCQERPAFPPMLLREIIDGTGPGREILLGGVVPVIDQVESWLRDAAGSRAPEGFNFRGAIIQVTSDALVRESSGPLRLPIWGPVEDMSLVSRLFFVDES
jgi:AcrR family transcriptional regulator